MIWTHINSRSSKHHYFVYQDWWWRDLDENFDNLLQNAELVSYRTFVHSKSNKKLLKTQQKMKEVQALTKTFTFSGLYRKFSEQDVMELIRLRSDINSGKSIDCVDSASLSCMFRDKTIFQIFFKDVRVLQAIINQLATHENFSNQHDENGEEMENSQLLRLHYLMSQHEIGREPYNEIHSKDASESLGFQPATIHVDGGRAASKAKHKQKNGGAKSQNPVKRVNCFSLLYRVLHEENTKSRDLIFKIASFCSSFSLANVFITQDDMKKVLAWPTAQVIAAFDKIAVETNYTKKILTLDMHPSEPFIGFRSGQFKISQDRCQY